MSDTDDASDGDRAGQRIPVGVTWPAWADVHDDSERHAGSRFSVGWNQTRSDIGDEMDRLGADEWAIESANADDFPGVVLRWRRDGQDYAICSDGYQGKTACLRECYLWFRETRMRNDRRVQSGEDEFAAARLPPGDEEPAMPPAHEILEVAPDASDVVVEASFREKVKQAHGDTDHDGDGPYSVRELKLAREELLSGDGDG